MQYNTMQMDRSAQGKTLERGGFLWQSPLVQPALSIQARESLLSARVGGWVAGWVAGCGAGVGGWAGAGTFRLRRDTQWRGWCEPEAVCVSWRTFGQQPAVALPDESAAICGRSCSYGIRPMGSLQAAWAIWWPPCCGNLAVTNVQFSEHAAVSRDDRVCLLRQVRRGI